MRGRARGAALVSVALVVVTMTGCDGEGEGSAERPTGSPSRSVSLPTSGSSPFRPTAEPSDDATEEPTDEPTDEATEEPTDEATTPSPSITPTTPPPSPTPTRTTSSTPTLTATPTPTRSQTPTETDDEGEAAPTVAPSIPPTNEAAEPTPSPGGGDENADEGVPLWVAWLLLAAAVAGVILAAVWVARVRARRAFYDRLEAAESEAAWVARRLLPDLKRTGTPEGVSGGWEVARPSVMATQDQLAELERTAPDESARSRARIVRDAVVSARTRVDAVAAGRPESWLSDVDAAIADIESALVKDLPTS